MAIYPNNAKQQLAAPLVLDNPIERTCGGTMIAGGGFGNAREVEALHQVPVVDPRLQASVNKPSHHVEAAGGLPGLAPGQLQETLHLSVPLLKSHCKPLEQRSACLDTLLLGNVK